ncbi:hypothetical protein SAMN06265373_104156 [Shimia sagamensis]|uniref:Uncharacterized protein n=1 Tax=Shimia sagamensis TaxID=1566352 RepID=A0ABY1P263_9RHOB|nr:hypothetical protein SAMN06265373_104156 [Shimia sagamensis]
MFFSALVLSALVPLVLIYQRGQPQPVAITRNDAAVRRGQFRGRPCPKSF